MCHPVDSNVTFFVEVDDVVGRDIAEPDHHHVFDMLGNRLCLETLSQKVSTIFILFQGFCVQVRNGKKASSSYLRREVR